MQKTHLAIGVIIGFIVSFLGTLLLLYSFTPFEGFGDFKYIKQLGYLGKFVTLGSIVNLLLFYIFLHKQKEYIARGILLATIIIAISTLFMQ
jgi:hypothetical protein